MKPVTETNNHPDSYHLITLSFGLLLALIACLPLSSRAQLGFSQLDADRLADIISVGYPRPSPDGRFVVFAASSRNRVDQRQSVDLWITETGKQKEPRQLTQHEGVDIDPYWSPDGRSIVYTSYRDSEPGRIYQIDLRGGAPRPLNYFPSDMINPRFSDDGRFVVFEALTYPDIAQNFDRLAIRLNLTQRDTRALHSSDLLSRRELSDPRTGSVRHLFALNVGTGEIRDLMPEFNQPYQMDGFSWEISPNSRYIVFSGNSTEPPYADKDNDIFLIDLETSTTRNITTGITGDQHKPVFTHTDDAIVYGQRDTPNKRSEFMHLVKQDLKSGKRRILTPRNELSPEHWLVDYRDRHVYFTAQQNGRRHIYKTTLQGNNPRIVVEGGTVLNLSIDQREQLYYLKSSFFAPAELYMAQSDGRHPEKLTGFNDEVVMNTRFGAVTDFSVAGANGDTVHGFMLLPPGFTENRRWPVLIMLHGGPHDAWLDAFSHHYNLALPTLPGYIVLALNVHGSTGYGQAFAASVDGRPSELGHTDIINAVASLRQLKYVDTDRLALLGVSYGGYLAYWTLSQSDLFRTGVIHAGVFDLYSHYASNVTWGREYSWGALPWNNPSKLNSDSPSHQVASLNTPIMILHGKEDQRVLPAQSLLAYNMLLNRNISTELVLFPDEAHSLKSATAVKLWWDSVLEWLERNLGAGPR